MSGGTIANIIADLEALRLGSLLTVDLEALDRMTSEQYIHVESNGRRRNKAEFLTGLANAEFRFESFVIEENKIRVSSDMAYAVGRYWNVVTTPTGTGPIKHARHIRIYENEDGVWRNVFHQATETLPVTASTSVPPRRR